MSTDEVSVVHLLWGDSGRAGDQLERRLREERVSRTALAKAGATTARSGGVLDERISAVVRDAVDVDLGGIVITSWTGYRALREAAARTRDAPGPPEPVVLAEHEITSTHQPLVDILIDGTQVQRLTFELVLALTLRSVVAMVDRGKLVAVRGGQVAASAALTLNGVTLAEGKHTWLPGAVVRLGDGIPLIGAVAPTSAARTSAAPTSAAAASATAMPASPAATSWVHQVSPNTPPAPAPAPSAAPWWERTTPAAADGQGGSR